MESQENRVEGQPGASDFGGRSSYKWKAYWQRELKAEHKRNQEWRRQADRITKRYVDKRKDQGPQYNIGTAESRVNLFYSNTYTQMAFMYGRIPVADVSRRFSDAKDDPARVAAMIFERMLNTSVDSDGGDFATTLRGNLEDFLVPGLGVARIRYEAAFEKTTVQVQVLDEQGQPVMQDQESEELSWEDAPVDYVHWRDFHWGYGRMWKDVPWIGFDVYMTREQATKRFGLEIAKMLKYDNMQVPAEDENTDNPDLRDPQKTAKVTEIWHKETEGVFWYHEDCEYVLDVKEDPLELESFYPTPRPMVANPSTNLFQPTPYYMLAQDLYNEVDQLSTRINIITNAVRVNGVFDKTVPQIRDMLQGSIENDLIPVDNWAVLAEKGGLKGVIEWFPVETVVNVLDKLRELRREAIDLLYQVTGLSDIMRGISEQYAGVGQEKLKAQFSGVRIQYLQDEFARWASDLLCLKAEVISKHFEPKTIIEQSNINFSYSFDLVQQALPLVKRWNRVLWRIEVKPESMAMVDWAQLKADRTEFINALATFMQSAAPLLEQDRQVGPMLLEMLKWGLSGFKGAQDIETVLDQAIKQYQQNLAQPQGEGKGDAEQTKSQLKLVENQQKFKQDMAKQADKAQKELEKLVTQFQMDLKKIQAETQAVAVKERVQADENIREKVVGARLGGPK